jgi:spermidine synthase
MPLEASRLYFCDLVGAGIGCLLVVGAIYVVGVPGVAALSATLFLLASAVFASGTSRIKTAVVVALALVWIYPASHVERVLEFKASKEKWINLANPEKIDFSKWSPIFRVDAYKVNRELYADKEGCLYGIPAKYIPEDMEFAQIAHDGDGLAMMFKSDRDLSGYEMLNKSILKVPYLIENSPRVLIIGAGGGVEVGAALQSKARSVLAVELDPITIDLVANRYADFVGHLYEKPEVKVIAGEGRSFLRRSDETFDVIQMTGVDTMAALTSGAYVLAENYLYTTEAYEDFLKHLSPDGVLSVAIFDSHYRDFFPRHTLRQTSISMDALVGMGIENPEAHIVVLSAAGSGNNYVLLLTKKTPFTFSQIRKLEAFVNDSPFELWHLPGRRFDNPVSHLLTTGADSRRTFYEETPLKLEASTDDSPFFFQVYKWADLLNLQHLNPDNLSPSHPSSGQAILILIILFSIVLSVILIIFPLLVFRRAGLRASYKWSYIFYFTALGLGFIFIEISYIQRFILFLGYPTYAITVVLFSLLVFSGVGSYLSGKLPLSHWRLILVALVLLSTVALSYIYLLPLIFDYFLSAGKLWRIIISIALLFPLAAFLGMFFPTGIKIVTSEDKRFVPWAWAINGCASVIGTVVAIVLAMSYGFSRVTFLAVAIYVIGVAAIFPACRGRAS